jgi:hypothetical protein
MRKKLPNRDYAPDKMYLFKYGKLDKTIVQSNTMATLMEFILAAKTSDKKWNKDRDSIKAYWEMCTEIARERKERARTNVIKRDNEVNPITIGKSHYSHFGDDEEDKEKEEG